LLLLSFWLLWFLFCFFFLSLWKVAVLLEHFFLLAFESFDLFFFVSLDQLLFLFQIRPHFLNIVDWNWLWLYVPLNDFAFNVPIQSFRDFHLDNGTKISFKLTFSALLRME
jgi:hypothetical protein